MEFGVWNSFDIAVILADVVTVLVVRLLIAELNAWLNDDVAVAVVVVIIAVSVRSIGSVFPSYATAVATVTAVTGIEFISH